jgi:hypothetical protein
MKRKQIHRSKCAAEAYCDTRKKTFRSPFSRGSFFHYRF